MMIFIHSDIIFERFTHRCFSLYENSKVLFSGPDLKGKVLPFLSKKDNPTMQLTFKNDEQ